MGKMTKAQAKKRIDECRKKVVKCLGSGHISMTEAASALRPLDSIFKKLNK
jgi:hypothetical protein